MMVKGLWQWLAVLGVAALCLMFTLAVWRYAVITSRHIADLEFERGAGRIERALTERIRQLETAVRAVQGFAESKAELDVTSWRAFADRLRLGEDGEGVAGVIYYRHEPATVASRAVMSWRSARRRIVRGRCSVGVFRTRRYSCSPLRERETLAMWYSAPCSSGLHRAPIRSRRPTW